jgi:hypothetical protein
MGEIITIFALVSFCLIAGYMLGFCQRLCTLVDEANRLSVESSETLARINAKIAHQNDAAAEMIKLLSEMKGAMVSLNNQTQQIAALPEGLYIPGASDQTGLTKLVPLRDDTR